MDIYKPHALIIGGTGMLKKVSLYISQKYLTSVVARTKSDLEQLRTEAHTLGGIINPISLDYTNTAIAKDRIKQAINLYGPVELVIAWIHSTAPDLPKIIADMVGNPQNPIHFYHILGSSMNPIHSEKIQVETIEYHQVILGFIVEHNSSRWLTNDEIADGVIKAMKECKPLHIVGSIKSD